VRPSQIAYDAAAIIAERGHCKHMLQDAEGRCCFSGAVVTAMTEIPAGVIWGAAFTWMPSSLSDEAYHCWRAVSDAADAIVRERGFTNGPIQYNNQERTSGEDVIQLLKEAGHRLEEKGT
jgi:hypothetical protein